ncbi:helix-turn-helix domain-containing protein [Sphingobium yanoikuyae]|uniref:helix-turn-helix domain-containing protein n=1 Tax=Sphingobium yanoikuyae TaxID=13690 RepID=UPI002430F6F7|nr:helix-turn-helix transcriptional regulator [Sphingobium yanoikuyae]
MNLAEYLQTPGKSATALATEIGCAVSTITRAANGETLPSRKMMNRIYEATGRRVHPRSYLETIP